MDILKPVGKKQKKLLNNLLKKGYINKALTVKVDCYKINKSLKYLKLLKKNNIINFFSFDNKNLDIEKKNKFKIYIKYFENKPIV